VFALCHAPSVPNPQPHRQTGRALTIGEHAHGQCVSVLSQVGQRYVGRPFADHEVDGDEALEDDGPCRVADAVLERPEDLTHAGVARVCRDEDVLDIFGLGGGGLGAEGMGSAHGRPSPGLWSGGGGRLTLILVAPLTDFSNELAMLASSGYRQRRAGLVRWAGLGSLPGL
jgi:hypothetical protein